MSVYLALPSKRRPDEVEEVLKEWRRMGYKVAVHRDWKDSSLIAKPDILSVGDESGYEGYGLTMNRLCRRVLKEDPTAEWIVAAGDDTLPDTTRSPEQIAEECNQHFYCIHYHVPNPNDGSSSGRYVNQTFGVMQPTGDPWSDIQGRIIERIAGSPWIGREFARRMYGGEGPYWREYTHCFVDEELQEVAIKMGIFWQNPAICQVHNNWARVHPGKPQMMPHFLAEANSKHHWQKYGDLFRSRKAANFPGHEPIG